MLVSRTRTALGAGAIVRDAAGYRLGVEPAEVDCVRLATLVRDAVAALGGELQLERRGAHRGLQLVREHPQQFLRF